MECSRALHPKEAAAGAGGSLDPPMGMALSV
jgi:hypothetical protein